MPGKRFIIILVLFLITLAVLSFLLSPFFTVRSLVIDGLDYLHRDEIREVLQPAVGQNIWMVDLTQLEQKLRDKGYIHNSSVERKLPGKLYVKVSERKPLAAVSNNGEYFAVSREGYILKIDNKDNYKIPVIEGGGFVFSGNKVVLPSYQERVLEKLDTLPEEVLAVLKKIVYEEQKLTLFLKSDIPVYMGSLSNLERKFLFLESTVEKITREELQVEYVDLEVIGRPVIKER